MARYAPADIAHESGTPRGLLVCTLHHAAMGRQVLRQRYGHASGHGVVALGPIERRPVVRAARAAGETGIIRIREVIHRRKTTPESAHPANRYS
jgi:hypothetical protein